MTEDLHVIVPREVKRQAVLSAAEADVALNRWVTEVLTGRREPLEIQESELAELPEPKRPGRRPKPIPPTPVPA
jgi:hypothetical protein